MRLSKKEHRDSGEPPATQRAMEAMAGQSGMDSDTIQICGIRKADNLPEAQYHFLRNRIKSLSPHLARGLLGPERS